MKQIEYPIQEYIKQAYSYLLVHNVWLMLMYLVAISGPETIQTSWKQSEMNGCITPRELIIAYIR